VATPTIVVLVAVAVATLLVVAGLVLLLARRLAGLARDLGELEQRLTPVLERLQEDADITGRELERVSSALDQLDRRRGHRR
jgi:hypothetical protein